MTDLESFRQQTRAWLESNAPRAIVGLPSTEANQTWGGRKAKFANPDMKIWLDRMAERGWTAPTWPTEYGGGGLSAEQAKILAQEMRSLHLPPPLVGFGLTMIGPTLLRFGNAAQKKQHLPRICRGDSRWCQGYSEPGAGSGLASLQTKSVREGVDCISKGTTAWPCY